MFGQLVKKQFMELSTLFSFNRRRSKGGSAGGLIFTLVIYLLIGFSLASGLTFFDMELADELLGNGEDWKYFVLLDLLGLLLATFITMFNADLTLFRAKDNEILLSMPIPPGYILLARMVPLYIVTLIFTASSAIPAAVIYRQEVGMGAGSIILNLVIMLALSLLALGLSTILGWLVSLLNNRLKGKSIVTTILSLAFLGVYFAFYFQMSRYTSAIVERSSSIAETIRKIFPPLYYLGLGHTGSLMWALIGVLSVAVIFGIIYYVLSRSFRAVVIGSSKPLFPSRKESAHREAGFKSWNLPHALLFKEYKHFMSNSSYMLNCGLGAFFMIGLSIYAGIKHDAVREFVDMITEEMVFLSGIVPTAIAFMLFVLISTCYYTMPSISLEGRSVWILQSLPIDPMKIFMSKIKMEYILCVPGILIFTTVMSLITGQNPGTWGVIIVAALAYTTFTAFFGLWINLLRPNMDWTNEAYPIKQGLNPLICLFGELILSVVLGLLYILVGLFIPAEAYLLMVSLVLFGVSFGIYTWLKSGGRRRFAEL